MIVTPDPAGSRSTYMYDAQNRLLTASKPGGATMSFNYDGLNRQVSRTVDGVTTYNVWDGWDLIEEYQSGGMVTAKYVYGATGLIKELLNNRYYYQDGSGSTSHLANSSGTLLEWYRYDLQGTPVFYGANDSQLSASNYSVRHLFTGQQWHQDVGLYDLRNRFYSPDLGRFLQPDPIGFWGGKNLYGYCGNNPVTRWDPFGLLDFRIDGSGSVTYGGREAFPGGNGLDSNFGYEPNPGGTGQGDPVVVGGEPGGDTHGGSAGGAASGPPGGNGGPGGSGGPGGVGGLGTGDGGPGGKTLANSPATSFLGKVLQNFNSQGGWKETAHALDSFAAFEVNLLLFGEGRVAWGVGRYVLGPAIRVTFTRGTIQSTVLRKPMIVSRYWGGESRMYGSYLTTADTVTQISSPNAASIALALPEGNTAATLSRFTIPTGTRVWTGGIANGADSATQVYVLNPDVLIIGGL